MNCETARDHLLEADLTELVGEGDGELARHLRACPECRERARRILDQTATLAAALEHVVPPAPSRALVASRASALERPAMEGDGGRWRAMRRWAVAVPLALAASLALMLLSRPHGLPSPTPQSSGPIPAASTPFDVQVPRGRAVTVFQTDNPNIVVIWSF